MVSVTACFIILASFGIFSLFNKFLEFGVVPIPKRYVGNLQYKWRSAVVSLLHSSVVGSMSIYSVPTIWSDFVLNYTSIGETTVAIFTGYMIYDIINLLIRNVNYSNVVASLIIHHVMGCFFGVIMIHHQQWLGYGILCLVSNEINIIFTHIRQLMLMNDVPKSSTIFRVNNMLFIVSFVTIRAPAYLIILVLLVQDVQRMTAIWHFSMIPGSAGLLLLNLYMFVKLLSSDYFVV
ncbi:TLC domain-containing protein 2-like [Amphiura filiformis]|uniref:TLC domain-containing protein 2-like n=1 Tax=Amphiura filiformis TaxID=82378 RepID=UPI003B20DCE2